MDAQEFMDNLDYCLLWGFFVISSELIIFRIIVFRIGIQFLIFTH